MHSQGHLYFVQESFKSSKISIQHQYVQVLLFVIIKHWRPVLVGMSQWFEISFDISHCWCLKSLCDWWSCYMLQSLCNLVNDLEIWSVLATPEVWVSLRAICSQAKRLERRRQSQLKTLFNLPVLARLNKLQFCYLVHQDNHLWFLLVQSVWLGIKIWITERGTKKSFRSLIGKEDRPFCNKVRLKIKTSFCHLKRNCLEFQ